MAEVLLFHHALGLTPGVLGFAALLRRAGHSVHAPDLYDGRTFTDLDAGVALADELGTEEVVARGRAAASGLPSGLVYAGFSLGSLPAQALAQSRPGARGALLFSGGVSASRFDAPWPASVPLQVHVARDDPWVELDGCRGLVDGVDDAELFVYRGSAHLFADPGSADYDADHARALLERVLSFLSPTG